MRLYQVYTYDPLEFLEGVYTREWAADWHAWKVAFDQNTINRVWWIEEPWAGPKGWGFTPDSAEAYSYVIPLNVTVP